MSLTRRQLAAFVAIDRAEYEATYADRPDAWQPLLPYVRAQALRIARSRPVQGIQVTRGEYGVTTYARIDWKKLTALVERQLPRWRETVARVNAEAAS